MSSSWNLPPGVSGHDVEWPPDIRSWHERATDFMHENRELPDDQPTREYVMQRFACDDEPAPDEVLAWVERLANLTRIHGTSQWLPVAVPYAGDTIPLVCPLCGVVGEFSMPAEPHATCPGCGNSPCACAPAA